MHSGCLGFLKHFAKWPIVALISDRSASWCWWLMLDHAEGINGSAPEAVRSESDPGFGDQVTGVYILGEPFFWSNYEFFG